MKYHCAIIFVLFPFIVFAQTTPKIVFSNITKTYGEGTFLLEASSENTTVPITYSIVSPNSNCIELNNSFVTIKGTGSVKIKASQAATSEYTATEKTIKLRINKKGIEIVPRDTIINYGEPIQGFKFDYNGFAYSDNKNSIDNPPVIVTNASSIKDVGEYTLSISGGEDNNYFFIPVDGKLKITKKRLEALAISLSREYGEQNPAKFAIDYKGFAYQDNESVLDHPPHITCDADSNSVCNSYNIIVSSGNDNNYDIYPGNGLLKVTPAPLVVVIDSISREYGAPNPPLTYHYIGFKLGQDSITEITIKPILTCNAKNFYNVGKYPINYTYLTCKNPNYSISYAEDSLTITRARLHIKIHSVNRLVGESNPQLHFYCAPIQFKLNENWESLGFDTTLIAQCDLLSQPGKYKILFNNYRELPNYRIEIDSGHLQVMDTQIIIHADKDFACKNNPFKLWIEDSDTIGKITWEMKSEDENSSRFQNSFADSLKISGSSSDTLHFGDITETFDKLIFRCIDSSSFFTYPDEKKYKRPWIRYSDSKKLNLIDSPLPAAIEQKGTNILICTNDSVLSYLWGFDNITLDAETKQFFYDPYLDTSVKDYWVVTSNGNDCKTTVHFGQENVIYFNSDDLNQKFKVTISPNPNSGKFNIEINHLVGYVGFILSIRNYFGQLLYRTNLLADYNGDYSGYMDKKLNPGCYVIEIEQYNQRIISKMIVIQQ
jgi:hypothetical protein